MQCMHLKIGIVLLTSILGLPGLKGQHVMDNYLSETARNVPSTWTQRGSNAQALPSTTVGRGLAQMLQTSASPPSRPGLPHGPMGVNRQPLTTERLDQATRKPGEWLLCLHTAGKSKQDTRRRMKALAGALNGELLRITSLRGETRVGLLRFQPGREPNDAQFARFKQQHGDVLQVQPNRRYTLFSEPNNEPLFHQQWGLANDGSFYLPGIDAPIAGADIRATAAWNHTLGDPQVIVAVTDTGIAPGHPDLRDNLWVNTGEIPDNGIDDDGNGYVDDVHGADFVLQTGSVFDEIGHGTHVAGIIGAVGDNSIGISGVAPRVSLMTLKIFGPGGYSDTFAILDSFQYAMTQGVRIINASWGTFFFDQMLYDAMVELGDMGVLFVGAAGNEAMHLDFDSAFNLTFPANFNLDNMVTVAATDMRDQLTEFSNFGAYRVHVAAPGLENISTVPGELTFVAEDFQSAGDDLPAGMSQSGDVNAWQIASTNRGHNPDNRAIRATSTVDDAGDVTTSHLYWPAVDYDGVSTLRLSFDFVLQVFGDFSLSLEVESQGAWLEWATLNGEVYDEHAYDDTRMRLPSGVLDANGRIRFTWQARPDASGRVSMFEVDNLRVFREAVSADDPAAMLPAYRKQSGTSMAAPHVAGVAALLLATNPAMSVNEMRMRLINTVRQVPALEDYTVAGGVVDAATAITASGGLKLHTELSAKTRQVTEYMPLRWSNFDNPDAEVTVELLHGDTVVADIAQTHNSGGVIKWFIPAVEPSDDYAIRLRADGDVFESERFRIEAAVPVAFPDPHLEQWMVGQFDRNQDGQITEAEAHAVRGVVLVPPLPVEDLTGVEEFFRASLLWLTVPKASWDVDLSAFNDLDSLRLSSFRNLRLQALPANLQIMSIQSSNIQSMPSLPENLSGLFLVNTPVSDVGVLPDSLLNLTLWRTHVQDLVNLPEGLLTLQLAYGRFENLTPPLPETLQSVDLSGNLWQTMPDLTELKPIRLYLADMDLHALPPMDLSRTLLLLVSGNQLTTLPTLPDSLNMLAAQRNRLTEIARFPESLARVDLSHNRLERLPALPPTLSDLTVSDNRLTTLPSLQGLNGQILFLDAYQNNLTALPELPPQIYSLRVSDNQLSVLPDLPQGLAILVAENNQLTSLPTLPPGLQMLNVALNQLETLPSLPTTLTNIDVSGNALSTVPDLSVLNNLFFAYLSDNHFSEVPNLPDSPRLVGVHLDRNPLGEMNRTDLDTLADRGLVGAIYLTFAELLGGALPPGEPVDGLVFNPTRDGSLIRLEPSAAPDPMTLAVTADDPDQHLLTWQGGASLADRAVSHYRVWQVTADGEIPLGTTHQTWFPLRDLLPGDTRTYRVEAIPFADDQAFDHATITYSAEALSASYRYVIPTFAEADAAYAVAVARARVDSLVSFQVYDGGGQLLMNQPAVPVAAGHKLVRAVPRASQPGSTVWAELTSNQPLDVQALTGADNELAATIDANAAAVGQGFVVVNASGRMYQSYVSLINPSTTPTTVTFNALDDGGQVLGTHTAVIPPQGRWAATGLTGFDADVALATAGVAWQADGELIAHTLSGVNDGVGQVMTPFQMHRPSLAGVLPLFGLILYHNPEPITAYLTISAYSKRGDLMAQRTVGIPGNSLRLMSPANLFIRLGASDRMDSTVSLHYRATSPLSMWSEVSGQLVPRSNAGEVLAEEVFPAVADSGSRFLVPHVTAKANAWQTMVDVIEVGDQHTPVTISALDGNGRTMGSVFVDIPAKGRIRFQAERFLEDGIVSPKRRDEIQALEVIGPDGSALVVSLIYFAEPATGSLMAGTTIMPVRD